MITLFKMLKILRKNINYLPYGYKNIVNHYTNENYWFSNALKKIISGSSYSKADKFKKEIVEYFLEGEENQNIFSKRNINNLCKNYILNNKHLAEHLVYEKEKYEKSGIPIYGNYSYKYNRLKNKWLVSPKLVYKDKLYEVKIHRFQHVPKLLLMYCAKNQYSNDVVIFLRQWQRFASKFTNRKLCFYSNIVVSQRILSCLFSLHLSEAIPGIDLAEKEDLQSLLVNVLLCDIHYILPQLGNSVSNNHLLIDFFTGWYLQYLYPSLVNSSLSEDYEKKWEYEFKNQIYSDGANFEHSSHYHKIICEMAVAYYSLCRLNKKIVPSWFEQRLEQSLLYQIYLSSITGDMIALGDSNDDTLFPLSLFDHLYISSFRAIYRELFNNDIELEKKPDTTFSYWMQIQKFHVFTQKKSLKNYKEFPLGGLYIFGQLEKSRLIFRTGPNKDVRSHYGHMHSDFHSVYFFSDGDLVFCDSGTYTYRFENKFDLSSQSFREYFMGVESHNTLSIRNQDPLGNLCGDFRDQFETVTTYIEDSFDYEMASYVCSKLVSGSIYNKYKRGILYCKDKYWIIFDDIPKLQNYEGSVLSFHVKDKYKVRSYSENKIKIKTNLKRIDILSTKNTKVLNEKEEISYVSERYGEKEPVQKISYSIKEKQKNIAFILMENTGPELEDLYYETDVGYSYVKVKFDSYIDHIFIVKNDCEEICKNGIKFKGRYLFMRQYSDKSCSINAYYGKFLHISEKSISVYFDINIDNQKLTLD